MIHLVKENEIVCGFDIDGTNDTTTEVFIQSTCVECVELYRKLKTKKWTKDPNKKKKRYSAKDRRRVRATFG